ncbi:MAG: hypothetical protein FJ399_17885, partial [Verrucomicrobia bacterium]|nr:hypothetical protein [Verrucomicrobiota bacterium]
MASEQVDRDATQRVAESAAGVVSSGGARPADPDATLRVAPLAFELVLSGGQRVFGRYTLEAEIGRGGMGVVWRARDEELGETVALKFLPAAVARDAVAVEELKDETRRARRLTHPNIVRIHDFVRDAAMAAVSMEYVDGQTLSVLRLGQPARMFSERTLEPLVKQICGALDYAHTQAKIVHRDLKPANVLVTKDGAVKITDFGIARSLTESTTRLTGKSGDTSGTLPYMSPQQLAGEKPMAADDIYALGSTLYELLTTKPPFHRGNPYSLMMQIREKTPLSLVEQRAELEVTGEPIPLAWVRTILACLAKEAGGRPSSAGEALARLGLGPPAGDFAEESGHVPRRTDERIKIEIPAELTGGASAVPPATVLEVAGTRCPSCGKATRETSRHCPHCGKDLTEACPECGGRNRAGTQFCEECGVEISAVPKIAAEIELLQAMLEGGALDEARAALSALAVLAAKLPRDGKSGLGLRLADAKQRLDKAEEERRLPEAIRRAERFLAEGSLGEAAHEVRDITAAMDRLSTPR